MTMMSRFAFAAFAVVVLPAFSALRPVAQWDVVPYQRISAPFQAGVVAFYDKPVKVEFSVNGKKVAEADAAARNPRTKVEEYSFILDPSKYSADSLKDRVLELGAKVVGSDGTSYKLPSTTLYWDGDGKTGSKKIIWLDPKDGIDYSDGSKDHPVKTMKQAVKRAGDGGTVYMKIPGWYTVERIARGGAVKYWTTVQPAPGLTRKDICIKGGRTGCHKLHIKNANIYSDILNGTHYALGGADATSECWIEDCIVRDKGGRGCGRSYIFGNKLTGYVTGGATTEMGDGPSAKIVRNHIVKSISADVFSGSDCLVVNCRVDDVDSNGVMDEPAFHRSQGIRGAWTANVILSNIKATNCQCHGLTGRKLRDSVFSNISLDTTGPKGRYVSRYAEEMENVWFNRVTVTGQEWEWFKSTNGVGSFTPTDVRVTESSFKLPPPEEK